MRRPLEGSRRRLLLALVGLASCERPDPNAPPKDPPSELDTGSEARPTLRFTSAPLPLGEPSQHHAVVALGPEGVALVAWCGERHVQAARLELETMAVEALPLGGGLLAHHPTLAVTDEGWLAAVTAEAGGLVGRAVGSDGRTLGPPAVLSLSPSHFPDLSVAGGQGASVWSDRLALRCLRFTGAFEALQTLDCPEPVQPELRVGSPAVRLHEGERWYVWTERDPLTTAFLVAVATEVDGAFVTTPVASHPYGGEMAGRPQLAADEGYRAVVWRGAEAEGAPIRSFLQALDAGGAPVGEPWPLGSAPGVLGTERPTVTSAGGLLLVAWEEEGELWLQLRDPQGAPLGPALPVAEDASREARRPSLDLAPQSDGRLLGLVSWESAPPGSETEIYDRYVLVRAFAL